MYGGIQIVAAAAGDTGLSQGQFHWIAPGLSPTLPSDIGLLNYDIDAPFVLPSGQTAIGRAEVALLPVGSAADLQVTLYPDNGSGTPLTNSPLASTVIPAAWITNLAAPDGLDTAGPLAMPRFNTLLAGPVTAFPWAQPAVGPNGAGNWATPVTSGNYIVLLGGIDPASGAASGAVATLQYLGDLAFSSVTPQPPVPQGAYFAMATATDNMLMFAGGVGTGGTTFFANAWTASWDPNTGTVGAWSAQAPIPVPAGSPGLIQGAAVSWGETVYIVGGTTTVATSGNQAAVYYASAVNGQISQWLTAPPLPQPLQCPFVGVVGNWLIVAGGQTTAGATSGATYYTPINPDGSLGGWRMGPSMPQPVYAPSAQWDMATTDSALIIAGGQLNGSTQSPYTQVLTVTADGLGSWQYQVHELQSIFQGTAFPSGDPGTWDFLAMIPSEYGGMTMTPVPLVSVPLPAAGLTAGATYHLVVHQIGGDFNNYVELGELSNSSPAWQYTAAGSGGPWTPHSGRTALVNIYDQTPTGAVLHAWVDPDANGVAAEASTYIHDSTGRLMGECMATRFVTQPGEEPRTLPSVAVLGYAGDGGMPTSITQLA